MPWFRPSMSVPDVNSISLELSISVIAGFSGDGRVYRAFGHLLALHDGWPAVLLVPLGRSTGDLRHVTDGIPIPWHQAWSVIDTPPAEAQGVPPETMCADAPKLALITPYGWSVDHILLPGVEHVVQRLSHVSGIRFARVAP